MIGQANFLQSLGWAVLNSLWQLALLWVIYQIINGAFRTAKSSFRSSLASSLLISGFAWFLYTFFSVYSINSPGTVISSALIGTEGNQQLNDWLHQSLPIASVLYLVLLVLPLLHFIRNYRYVQVIRKFGLTKINANWRMFVTNVSARMGISKKVSIWVSEFVSSPVTVGFLKPVILVPLAAINHLTPQQLEAVLLHELGHIKRYDYLVNLIINFIQSILYFNPFVKAFVRIVEREREKSCDEMVLQFQYDSHDYATALLALEKNSLDSKPLAVAASGKKNDLLHRVEIIMGVQKKSALSFNKLAGLMAGLLCVIALNAFLLFSKPGNDNRAASLAEWSPSFSFSEAESNTFNNTAETIELSSGIINRPEQKQPEVISTVPSLAGFISSAVNNPEIINVNYDPVEIPELKKYQEEQVVKAMEASKKVLESVQWKFVEKSIADVFSMQEKEELKASYEKQLEKMDWNKWENKLKLAYNKIDWDKINTELAVAVNQIRIDSIQMVYSKAISKLDVVTKELCRKDMQGIPDTDITLKEIERKKADVQRALNELKANRNKKIVHL
ncbi:MAG: M56 family metallopeptidase [Chitinophagaceae bacterium]